jgi:hypothetical protein
MSAKDISKIFLGLFTNGGTLLVAQLIEALRYKPEDCGFDFRWCNWISSLT